MPSAILRNTVSGAFTEQLDTNTEMYQALVKQRDGSAHSFPLWEEAAEEDAALSTKRVAIGFVRPLGLTVSDSFRVDADSIREGGSITSAEYIPNGAATGAATNTRTLTVVGEVGGTGHATLALLSGVNLAAGVASSFTINSAALTGSEDLAIVSTSAGTGIVDPGGIVTIEYTRTA